MFINRISRNIDNLHDRFRNYTFGLFKKDGIAGKAFGEDPEWIKAKAVSEVKGGGSLTTNVVSELFTHKIKIFRVVFLPLSVVP